MSHTHPISVTVFDHFDNPVFNTTNYTGYIPRANERLSMNKKAYRVSNVEYIYDNFSLAEVQVITIPLAF